MIRKCSNPECEKQARAAIKTTDGTRGMTTVLYYDDRAAPMLAYPLCKAHAAATLLAIVMDQISEDG